LLMVFLVKGEETTNTRLLSDPEQDRMVVLEAWLAMRGGEAAVRVLRQL
jgi:hypothetical protein